MDAVQLNSDKSDKGIDSQRMDLVNLDEEWKRRDELLSQADAEIKTLTGQLRQTREVFAALAGSVAHELNNQLTVIAGYTDILLMSLRANDRNRDSANAILEAVKQAAVLTRRLIAFKQSSVSRN